MIKTFVEETRVGSLISIGCCYNLLPDHPEDCGCGPEDESCWPLSKDSIKGLLLTRDAKMAACQNPYRWQSDLAQTRNFFKRHYYRALIEPLLQQFRLDEKTSVGNIPDSCLASFGEYTRRVMSNLALDVDFDELSTRQEQKSTVDRRIAFVWTLRALLGMVIEMVILYDRYIYIKEHCSSDVYIVPLFDANQSPRNKAIVAIKK